ncbi:hypothetical protein CI102_5717 [Trichoderma harzianum]|uniref:Uncharacterized protein n=1 Tax=Trichoderma harzianum CBS 226.95 TaxID=983964 RepID=A0A2T4AE27_TRIHA|nr:hypothetical protein M431DRAFT_398844 [Trichoderma harzianum CBS 226.95]PKK47580.1 hypothetical protein CI102_5717 [Trichoderma harzianum]PTB55340.1 hypothetical protein M431DRAFT_398844 [Trichoderma harzianum CBS 226.95]
MICANTCCAVTFRLSVTALADETNFGIHHISHRDLRSGKVNGINRSGKVGSKQMMRTDCMRATHQIFLSRRCCEAIDRMRERENEDCFGADSSARDTPQSADDEMKERGEEPQTVSAGRANDRK